jgi:hypothetical protein
MIGGAPCARAAAYGVSTIWPAIAARYGESFARAQTEHTRRRRTAFVAQTLATRSGGLPDMSLKHVQAMTDDTGMLQHAIFSIPRYDDGYCLDDNARALLLMALLEDAGSDDAVMVRALARVGLSPPLIETDRGWLMLYHGVRRTAAGVLYRLGVALLDLETAEHCLLRGDSRIFGPEAPYEREGDVGYVAFPCGYTLGLDGDAINLYYGAADTSVALATGSVRELLGWLDRHGTPGSDAVKS